MGREMGGRLQREGIYVYLQLIPGDVWQKPTQFYKAIIIQLKINKFKIKKKKKKNQVPAGACPYDVSRGESILVFLPAARGHLHSLVSKDHSHLLLLLSLTDLQPLSNTL